ncbi:hypothetical protein BS47DRAFT_1395698 [Hydnum rufescens UP504]|uniref:Uncharacterized protein n=1 Tax=Hydnum rufescens UP504 TaxID=1448309 RepID=A0A9P6DR51_9AGAM|nr:hypothetical protein BS47DRAFT_1395698 [Hydnum rufescens UP504]
MSAMSTSPAVLSGGGNLASSSSNPNRELEPGSVTSGEGTLVPSSLQIDVLNRKACLESDDQMPLPMSTDLLGFPSPSDWKVANQKAQERITFEPAPALDFPTDFTIVPHTFNQFQPWYAYIRHLKSNPPFVSDSVYDRVNGVRCLSYPYYNKCWKFFQTSKALYKGWLEVARDWLGNESQWPKAPVVPATLSLCDELEDIQHKNKDVLCVNGLIITAYEFNGYASYLMFCCINKLVETFKADAPVFCIDDRIIGAVFGNSVGNKETVWREELE